MLLFSQMTRVLDVIQDFLDLRAIPHLRLDGTTRAQDRRARSLTVLQGCCPPCKGPT